MQPFSVTIFLLLAAVSVPICGCQVKGKAEVDPVPPQEFEDDSIKVFADPAGKAYFPEGTARWYTRYFLAMKEPSLQPVLPPGATFILRFTILPSFTDDLMVRIYDKDGKIYARAVRQKKDQRHNPQEITHDKTAALDDELPKEIKSLFANKEFWTPLNGDEEGNSGFEGEGWIFELKDRTGYHMLDIWSPEYPRPSDAILKEAGFDPAQLRDYAPYVKAGNALLELMKLKREEFKSE